MPIFPFVSGCFRKIRDFGLALVRWNVKNSIGLPIRVTMRSSYFRAGKKADLLFAVFPVGILPDHV